jgi:hypothetical protein
MTKIPIKNTVGPYPIVCVEVEKVGSTGLDDWIKSHSVEIQTKLMEHVLFCHRCSQIFRQTIRAAGEEIEKMSHEEQQALMNFDPATCAAIAEHRKDLVDWVYSIREDGKLFYDVIYHLGMCDNCPVTDEELGEIFSIPD